MIIILFGLSGSGKTYIGNLIAKYFDFFHFDADQLLTEDMIEAIEENKSFNVEMLDDFTQLIINKITYLKKIYPKLVVSQGLYRRKNRESLKKKFINNNIRFVHIDASDDVIIQRLKERNNNISPNYAEKMKQNFELMEDSIIINNDNKDTNILLKQLKKIESKL